MGRLYTDQGSNAVEATETLATYQSATTVRPELQDLVVGCGVTPGDQATLFDLYRFSVDDGTGSASTPEPLDPGDPAALGIFQVTHTTEPNTIGAILLVLPLHQRATFRWVAAPGRGFKADKVATEGWGFRSLTATGTAVHNCTMIWEE